MSPVSPAIPDHAHRWRCGGCGNLTRFDVTRTRRTTEFWHVDLSGRPEVEATEVRDEAVESVVCRWCGRGDAIEVVRRADVADVPDPTGPTDAPAGPGPGGAGPAGGA